jgi:acyl-CoA thioester hydrolase
LDTYSNTYEIRWSDLDANGHVHYSTYIDAAADLRYRFFSERGFPPDEFLKLGLGVAYNSIEARFLREVRIGETISISYALAAMSPSGLRWRVHHDILKSNGKKAVTLEVEGVLLELSSRRAVPPTPELFAVFQQVPRLPAFEMLSERRAIG